MRRAPSTRDDDARGLPTFAPRGQDSQRCEEYDHQGRTTTQHHRLVRHSARTRGIARCRQRGAGCGAGFDDCWTTAGWQRYGCGRGRIEIGHQFGRRIRHHRAENIHASVYALCHERNEVRYIKEREREWLRHYIYYLLLHYSLHYFITRYPNTFLFFVTTKKKN